MWSAGRYVRCQAYASGPMSIPDASHDINTSKYYNIDRDRDKSEKIEILAKF